MNALSAADIQVRLGDKQVLDGVSATFHAGEVTALVGPNGAGKSTFLECLAGLRRPDRGTVRLGGAPLQATPARRRAQQIGFLPQAPEVAWAVDARTFIGLGRTPHLGAWGPGAEDQAAVEDAIAATGLEAFAGRVVSTLSGGERARVLVARVLAGRPSWLLADEPLAGLDPRHALETLGLFRRMAHDQGQGVIVTLHDLGLAVRTADRVLVLADGKLVADGLPTQALTPQVLRDAYGVEARITAGAAGPLIEVTGLAG